MIIPIRCFTCGKVIAQFWVSYKKSVDSGINPANVLDDLRIRRICCRRMFLGQIDLIDKIQ